MRKIVILLLILVFAAAIGCSEKKEAEQRKTTIKREVAKGAKRGYLIDPVSKNPVDIMESPYSYIYKDVEYNFQTKENMDAFIKNPEKYIAELEEMMKK
jgi:YHS domain-containing protein